LIITKETDYALRILRTLANGRRLTTSEIARCEQVPKQFAYKIIKKLQKGGIVSILRGADGGCALAADLESITMRRLMHTMEEDSSVCSCMKPGYKCNWRRAHGGSVCHAHAYLISVQKKIDGEFEAHNLKEILFGG
jgi:Rrf2 family protein